jgi:hypothetical protein
VLKTTPALALVAEPIHPSPIRAGHSATRKARVGEGQLLAPLALPVLEGPSPEDLSCDLLQQLIAVSDRELDALPDELRDGAILPCAFSDLWQQGFHLDNGHFV